MPVLGIIAEYDPFHNGHLHHLQAAAGIVSPSAILIALSGPFRQRGTLSLLSPFTRAECALSAGASAVFALPVLWTLRDAEHYALGAVSMLSSLGITHLAFGAENANLILLQKTAQILEDMPESVREKLRTFLSEGNGYPASLSRAVMSCFPECGEILNHPNNILAVCYLRIIRRLSLPITPVVIPRIGKYNSDIIVHESPSASAISAAILRGSWNEALQALPPITQKRLRSDFLTGTIPDPKRLDTLLLEKLRSMSLKEASNLPDCQEGLHLSLLKASNNADSRSELIEILTTRRYSAARISRICAYALLGITKDDIDHAFLPDTALLLAIKKNPQFTGSWKNAPINVVSVSDWLETASPAEAAAWRIWSECCGKPASWPFTQKIFTSD